MDRTDVRATALKCAIEFYKGEDMIRDNLTRSIVLDTAEVFANYIIRGKR